MEEILIVILQFLFELIVEALSYIPFDWIPRGTSKQEPDSISTRCFFWFCGGCLLAGASLLVFRHTLISVSSLRMANVALAPVASAFFSQAIARRRADSNPFIVPRNHFWQAFWFTAGLTLIRFVYASRT